MLYDGWNVDVLDTAGYADYLTRTEKDVFLAMNALRTDPAKFARCYVGEIIGYYDGALLTFPAEIPIRTYEGAAAARALYDWLATHMPLGPIYPSWGLSKGAADHAADQSLTGRTSHVGSDGSDPFSRMNRYGTWGKTAAENIAYGKDDGLRIVLQLAIDDGVASRGHRDNLLSGDFRVAGVGINTHPEYGHSCTIDYAAEYLERT